ncbi:hypothetical protein FC89_GL000439 [Liquorilactobacillus ghanensis DSM 18630]|uniref:Uncharacterized protein n=1 Tax=Liquorilactobacillus ghanensis DSM 18630 TaxID=1423750 RepID=A0A0R1VVR1_9LACO|nr:hypothetical protein FC89_GL000439 [Liquorilactobacillus ghanensis DSM 18630]
MLPILKKIYPEKDDFIEMMSIHNQFFNTNAYVGGFIVGMDIALEKKVELKLKMLLSG